MSSLSPSALSHVQSLWSSGVQGTIEKYISIPNQSPAFDAEWESNGLLLNAMELLHSWVQSQASTLPGLTSRVLNEPGRTPTMFITVPGNNTNETVLMYGHMDKQPPMTDSWAPGLHPHTPVIRDGKLYGRGGADDGYSVFAALNALQVLKTQSLPHARIAILIEGCEESGSRDLEHFMRVLASEIGTPSLIFCLDSGCANYEQLWLTSSLRGMVMGNLTVEVLSEAVHSGKASGIVPSSFRVIRQLLDRIEDAKTGKLLDVCYAPIPEFDKKHAKLTAETVGSLVVDEFPFVQGAKPITDDLATLLLNRAWGPTLCYTGVDGMPLPQNAGNVLRPKTTIRLSIRLPPTVDANKVGQELKRVLEADAPYSCKVSFFVDKAQSGWCAPPLDAWLEQCLDQSSNAMWKNGLRLTGEGGSIPFMGMLGDMFPQAQFVITGVLGPGSNAHGPNEFLHIDYTQRLTCCVANVLHAHYLNKVAKQ